MSNTLRWAVLRLVLLGAVAVGVFSMHTIGHSGDHAERTFAAHPTDPALGIVSPGASGMADAMIVSGCGEHGCAPVAAAIARTNHPDRHPTRRALDIVAMCLAILVVGGALAMLSRALSRRHRVRLAEPGRSGPVRAPAPSPRVWNLSLRLVDVAVLRT